MFVNFRYRPLAYRAEQVLNINWVALDVVSAPHIHRPYFFARRLVE